MASQLPFVACLAGRFDWSIFEIFALAFHSRITDTNQAHMKRSISICRHCRQCVSPRERTTDTLSGLGRHEGGRVNNRMDAREWSALLVTRCTFWPGPLLQTGQHHRAAGTETNCN